MIDPERERHSFVFFFYPSFDAPIPSSSSSPATYSILSSQVKAEEEQAGSKQEENHMRPAKQRKRGALPKTFEEFITWKWAEVQR